MTIIYEISPDLSNWQLNELLASIHRADHQDRDFRPVLRRSLCWVCAYTEDRRQLVGFVNVAWDGGLHAFILDTSVRPSYQRQGIGTALVRHAIEQARTRRITWLHVDYEPHLEGFYAGCGFQQTAAGLMDLQQG